MPRRRPLRERGISVEEAERRLGWQQRLPALADRVRAELPARFGGLWIAPAEGDRIRLGVVGSDASTLSSARSSAAAVDLEEAVDVVSVRYSESKLIEIAEWLGSQLAHVNADAPGGLISGVRANENSVRLSLPKDVGLMPKQQALVDRARDKFGPAVEVGFYEGEGQTDACDYPWCTPPLRGGIGIIPPPLTDQIYADCTAGFVARSRSDAKLYVLTVGHCRTFDARDWWTRMPDFSRRNLGPFHNHYLGGFGDAGIIRIPDNGFWTARSWVIVTDSPDLPGHPGTTANHDYRIRSDADPPAVLTRVCKTGAGYGSTSCGYVTETFHTDQEGVSALVRATYCRIGGDSGGPVFATHTAYGVHRGGYSNCDAYFTKAQVAESLMNVNVTHASD